ncbi:MAG: hypothetical protein AAFN11_19325 [Chloroflexota bacterium]
MIERINGRYILHEKLGSGGMGAVYRATDRLTDSIVALKRVRRTSEKPSSDTPTNPELICQRNIHDFGVGRGIRRRVF